MAGHGRVETNTNRFDNKMIVIGVAEFTDCVDIGLDNTKIVTNDDAK